MAHCMLECRSATTGYLNKSPFFQVHAAGRLNPGPLVNKVYSPGTVVMGISVETLFLKVNVRAACVPDIILIEGHATVYRYTCDARGVDTFRIHTLHQVIARPCFFSNNIN